MGIELRFTKAVFKETAERVRERFRTLPAGRRLVISEGISAKKGGLRTYCLPKIFFIIKQSTRILPAILFTQLPGTLTIPGGILCYGAYK